MAVEPYQVYLAVGGLIAVLGLLMFLSIFKKLIKNKLFLMIIGFVLGLTILLLILPQTRDMTVSFFTGIYLFFVNGWSRATLWYNTNALWLKTKTDVIIFWFRANPVITNGIILTVGVVAAVEGISLGIKYLTTRALRYFQRKVILAFIKTVVAFSISAVILTSDFMFINPMWTQTVKVLASVIISQGVASEGVLGTLKDTVLNALWKPA